MRILYASYPALRAVRAALCWTVMTRPWGLLRQWLHGDFLEEDDIVVAVILQAKPANERSATTPGLEVELFRRHRIAFSVVGDLHAIEHDDGVWAVEHDLHGVPLGAGFAGLGERLGQRVERAGNVVLVFIRRLGVVVDLHFVAVVHRHPFFARLDGNADEDAGVVIFVAHSEDHADSTVADGPGGPVQQAHAAVSLDESVFDGHEAGANVLPAVQVLAVEELYPAVVGLRE